MKLHPSRALTLVAALIALTSDAAAQAAATNRAAAPGWHTLISEESIKKLGGDYLGSVDFQTRHVGWAVGSGGKEATLIFRTTDGGKHWERVPLLDGQSGYFTAVRFADARNGWIAGWHHLLRTTDGGENWDPVEWGPSTNASLWAKALLPLGPDGLIIGSDQGMVRITEDGGRTWRTMSILGGRTTEHVSALGFLPPSSFFAVTNGGHLSPSGVYRSDDGGRTWASVIEEKKPLSGIDFHGSDRGIVVGDGVAYSTSDGGATWRKSLVAGTRNAVRFIDENTIVAVGTSPHVMVSDNGGRTWKAGPNLPLRTTLTDVDAVDGGWWYATGRGSPGLYHFVDPGYTAVVAEGSVAIPTQIKLPGGKSLPAGMYRVSLAHRGERHLLGLRRTGAAPRTAEEGPAASPPDAGAGDAGACNPCEAEFPVEVEYETQEEPAGGSGEEPAGGNGEEPAGGNGEEAGQRRGIKLSVQPTDRGLAIVLDAAVVPPRDFAIGLAALGVSGESPVEATITTREASRAKERASGLAGRLRKAASGDVRGAVADAPVNPRAVTERIAAVKAAPPAIYRIKVTYPIEILGGESGSRP